MPGKVEQYFPDESFLDLRGITKRFGKVVANDHIDLTIRRGEVHTLFGENGSGKTTLSNIIYGFLRADEGSILFKGQPVEFRSPSDAMEAGIGMVHQHFKLVPTLTVAQNAILGLRSGGNPFLDLKTVYSKIGEFNQRYRAAIDPDTEIWKLSVGEQQWVEILKALYLGIDLLILDEPTAVLIPQEIENLLIQIQKMKAEGLTVIFISHKLNEIMQISDRITVLRRGKVVSTVSPNDVSKNELVKMMVGKEVSFNLAKAPMRKGEVALRLENIQANSDRGYRGLNNLSLEVCRGEILGIAGVSGNGQVELFEIICAIRPITSGKIWIMGKDITSNIVTEIEKFKVSEIPEDRNQDGVILDFSLANNMILGRQREKKFLRGFFLDTRKIVAYAIGLIKKFDIRPSSPAKAARTLSGGNLQKLILAREFARSSSLFIIAQPTRGLDVAATEFIRRKLLEERKAGVAILLISEDLDELMNLSDRIDIIFRGKIVAEVEPEKITVEKIGFLMVTGKAVGSD